MIKKLLNFIRSINTSFFIVLGILAVLGIGTIVLNGWILYKQKQTVIKQSIVFGDNMFRYILGGISKIPENKKHHSNKDFLERINQEKYIYNLRIIRGKSIRNKYGNNNLTATNDEKQVLTSAKKITKLIKFKGKEELQLIYPVLKNKTSSLNNCTSCHISNSNVLAVVSFKFNLKKVNESYVSFRFGLLIIVAILGVFTLAGILQLLRILLHTMKELKKKDDLIETELIMAKDIQAGILPDMPAHFNCMNVEAYYKAMEQVGGDLYEIFPMKQGYYAILMADVSGHGIPAALITAMAKISFSEALRSFERPKDILKHVNNDLIKTIKSDDYLTAFLVLVGPSFNLSFSNAAHRKAIICRKENLSTEELDTEGFVLGIMDGIEFEEKSEQLHFGDRLFLYTDGLVEATNKDKEEFGEERVMRILEQTMNIDLKDVKKTILERWLDFTENTKISDDMAFLILELDSSYTELLKLREKGNQHYHAGEIKQAIECFESGLQYEKTPGTGRTMLARCYYKHHNYTKAMKHLKVLQQVKPQDAEINLLLASCLFIQKKYKEALVHCKKITLVSPYYSKSLLIQGVSHARIGKKDKALRYLQKALKVSPRNKTIVNEINKLKRS